MRAQGVKRNASHGAERSCASTKQAYQWHKWHNIRRIAYVHAHVGRNQNNVPPTKTDPTTKWHKWHNFTIITLTRTHTHGTSNKKRATCAIGHR